MNPECPSWPGAEKLYQRWYRILENAQREYMSYNSDKSEKGWKRYLKRYPWPTEAVSQVVEKLNEGDEEWLKGALYYYNSTGYIPGVGSSLVPPRAIKH